MGLNQNNDLGFQAQTVDGVLGLGVPGQQSVVFFLQPQETRQTQVKNLRKKSDWNTFQSDFYSFSGSYLAQCLENVFIILRSAETEAAETLRSDSLSSISCCYFTFAVSVRRMTNPCLHDCLKMTEEEFEIYNKNKKIVEKCFRKALEQTFILTDYWMLINE